MRASFIAHIKELLRGLGRLEAKPMFGGHGLYCDGAFFAIVKETYGAPDADPGLNNFASSSSAMPKCVRTAATFARAGSE